MYQTSTRQGLYSNIDKILFLFKYKVIHAHCIVRRVDFFIDAS